MCERQPAHNRLEAGVGERQLTQVGDGEAGLGHVHTGQFEHLWREVDAGDGVPEIGQAAGVAARTAGSVKRAAKRARREQLTDGALLDRDDRISRLVVGVRPDRVAGGGAVLRVASAAARAGSSRTRRSSCRRCQRGVAPS